MSSWWWLLLGRGTSQCIRILRHQRSSENPTDDGKGPSSSPKTPEPRSAASPSGGAGFRVVVKPTKLGGSENLLVMFFFCFCFFKGNWSPYMILFVKKQNILWNLERFFSFMLCQVTKNWWFGVGGKAFFWFKKTYFLNEVLFGYPSLGGYFFLGPKLHVTWHAMILQLETCSPVEKIFLWCRFVKFRFGCFQKWGYSTQNGWFISWKTLLKWMIWGVKTPIFGNTHLLSF